MKITKQQLQQIISEETRQLVKEQEQAGKLAATFAKAAALDPSDVKDVENSEEYFTKAFDFVFAKYFVYLKAADKDKITTSDDFDKVDQYFLKVWGDWRERKTDPGFLEQIENWIIKWL